MSKAYRFPFQIPNGTKGTALILPIPLHDGRTLITCANENEEDDAPVNMAVERLFAAVCERLKLDPAKVVWVEYTSYTVATASGAVGGWELVTFTRDKSGRVEPDWRQMTPDDWKQLGTTPPPGPSVPPPTR